MSKMILKKLLKMQADLEKCISLVTKDQQVLVDIKGPVILKRASKKGNRLTDATRRKIYKMLEKNYTLSRISMKVNVSVQTIAKMRKEMNNNG